MKLFSPLLAFSSFIVLVVADSDGRTGSSATVDTISTSTVIVDNNGPRTENLYPPKELNSRRRVKSGKGKNKDADKDPLYADIKTRDTDGDFPDMGGWVTIEYNDNDKLVIDYSIKEGPKRCKDCVLAIYSGKSCSKLDDPHYDTDENPWTKDKGAVYITNKNRRAAGYFKLGNGYSYKKNECKFVVLLDKPDDDRRRLDISSSSSGRKLGKGKKKGAKKLACGQLIPENQSKDYCD